MGIVLKPKEVRMLAALLNVAGCHGSRFTPDCLSAEDMAHEDLKRHGHDFTKKELENFYSWLYWDMRKRIDAHETGK